MNFREALRNPHCDKPQAANNQRRSAPRALERAQKVEAALGRAHNEHVRATAELAASCSCDGRGGLSAAGSKNRTARKGAESTARCISGVRAPGWGEQAEGRSVRRSCDEDCHAKRVKTAKGNKRCEIDPTNRTPFGETVRGAKMRGERGTGIEEMLEVHCEGSEAKLLDIVYAIIGKYKLQAQVKGHFGITVDATNAYIVGRAKAALKELKHCRSERQRQQYRLVLTVLAPESGLRKAEPVADALGVGRQGKPFLDAIQMRAEVDRLIKASEKQLQVGDEVLCRHGKGTLIEVDSDYDSEDGSCGKPCAVEIEILSLRRGPSP